ncbi:L-iditol 2-dehydrogenase [Pelosinus fermentans]|uniref:Alcohol dehydrogenase GroES domain protein n=1 Tax=Pelosinus fermentans B4 TaxID=1149862 RepID=I9LEY5_9FIRM|nr:MULTISPECIES: zinc-binding dehydrogenase [Pelosinus]EIW19034.1 Alcohol dehydrogenase GroES domain protein [Pelosinus fermentans B4]OAM95396.1 L-iditol 2-dehydrogenase [Pelosinus fermentans DSM 17108]SDR27496.1 L-iditol 2-dehydrogenase [Pelosinus fermentans]
MRALVKTELGHGNLVIVDKEEPKAGKDQVKILVKYAGICGSDLHTYEGKYKVKVPVTLGHEFAGEVVEVGENVTDIHVGERVTSETTFYICGECKYCKSKNYNLCKDRKGLGTQQDGAFTKYIIANKNSIHKLPENVDYLSASITEALACAHHAVAKSSIKKNDVVVVLGPGPIGLLVAQIAKTFDTKVIITGLAKDKSRLDKAKELGIDVSVDIQNQDVKQIVDELSDGYGADIVFECTGAPPSVNLGLDILTKQGEYVQVGIFPTAEILTDFEKIIQKEIKITGCRSQKPSDWEPSLQLMNQNLVNAKALVSHQFNITEWDKAYETIKKGDAIKVVLTVE